MRRALAGEDVGSYAITQGSLALPPYYDLAFKVGTLTIDKIAITVTKTNSGRWVEKSVSIPDASFANQGPKSSDFSLVNEDEEDDIFHMIEITKSN